MSTESEFDRTLREQFAALRQRDEAEVPAFGAMRDRARQTVSIAAATPVASTGQWSRTRVLRWSAPFLAIAAALTIFLLQPNQAAEREFEQRVADWSRTSAATHYGPTDALLAVPGSEYLRRVPIIGTDGTPRARRPS